MEAVGEPVSIGGFSKMEYLVIAIVVQSLMSDDWNWEQLPVRNINVGDVSTIYYYYILELVQTLQLDLVLFERKQDSIKKLLE